MPDAPAPTERSSDRVDDDIRHRPGYPAALPAWLRQSQGIDHARMARRAPDDDAMRRWFGDGLQAMACFPHRQRFDFDGLRGRLLSSSSAPQMGQPGHEAMMDALRALFERHAVDGQVDFDYDTRVFVGTLG
jgi:hypothetical protein